MVLSIMAIMCENLQNSPNYYFLFRDIFTFIRQNIFFAHLAEASSGHEKIKGHHSHQGSKDYSVGVEGDYICAWPGTRGYPGICH